MALVSGGSSAVNHWYDRDIDALMERTSERPVASGRVAPGRRRSASGSCSRRPASPCSPLQVHWLAAVWALRRLRLLRARLHRLAQAPHAAEHRHRRRGGRRAPARRLGRGGRLGERDRRRALRDRLPLDAAPLLGAGAAARRGLRARRRADAADGARRQGERAADPRLHAAPASPPRSCRSRSARSAGSTRPPRVVPRRPLHLARACALLRAPDDRATARRTFLYSLLYLALLFVAMGVDSAL